MLMSSFDKSDLKGHMIVKLRDGRYGIVFGNYIYTNTCLICIDNYKNNLTMGKDRDYADIVQVFTPLSFNSILNNVIELWNRDCEETKEVTMSEVEKKFGCKIKIINDK